jgi:hypothetical protein
MADGRFPKPYVDSIPPGGDRSLMVYVPFDKTDIGANSASLPATATEGGTLTHVGKSATSGGRQGRGRSRMG